VPSTDHQVSSGDYGVITRPLTTSPGSRNSGDPNFLYEQEMRECNGLEIPAHVGCRLCFLSITKPTVKEIVVYLDAAVARSKEGFAASQDFSAAMQGARGLQEAGAKMFYKDGNSLPRRSAQC